MCAVHGGADRSSRRDLPRKCSDMHAWSCSRTVRARADAPASMCRPCTLCTRTPLAQDGRQVHTCRAESALDGNSGFDHAVMMSVQTKSRGQCGMRAPLHRCTALPPGSAHAAKGKICLSVKISRRENISFLPDPAAGQGSGIGAHVWYYVPVFFVPLRAAFLCTNLVLSVPCLAATFRVALAPSHGERGCHAWRRGYSRDAALHATGGARECS